MVWVDSDAIYPLHRNNRMEEGARNHEVIKRLLAAGWGFRRADNPIYQSQETRCSQRIGC